MASPLKRQRRDSTISNPFLELEKKEHGGVKETLKTMKVPIQTHKKLLALSKVKNQLLYEMIDFLAEHYIQNELSEEELKVYAFVKDKGKGK